MNEIVDSINRIANELVMLNPVEQFEQAKTLVLSIYDLFWQLQIDFKRTDRYGNDWYEMFELSITVPMESILEAMAQLLRTHKKTGEWLFKPENGDFITTLVKRIKQFVSLKIGILPGIIPEEDDIYRNNKPDPTDSETDIDILIERIARLQSIAYIADLINKQAWLPEGHKNKSHFEGFFTHDTVNETWSLSSAEINHEYDTVIYSSLCQKMLSYLILDVISCLRDVCGCRIRDGISLKQRNENVAACYELKSPKYYSAQYSEWITSVKPAS